MENDIYRLLVDAGHPYIKQDKAWLLKTIKEYTIMYSKNPKGFYQLLMTRQKIKGGDPMFLDIIRGYMVAHKNSKLWKVLE